MAELLYGSMRSSFDFTFDGYEMRGEDGGSMDEIFDDSITEARLMTEKNPSLLFELRRRLIERGELEDMKAIANGELLTDDGKQVNTMVVLSDFPPELMEASEDLGGYNATRKQTMLRVITKQEDGTIRVVSQSLDQSNRLALEKVSRSLGKQPDEGELLSQRINLSLPEAWQPRLVDNLVDTYDKSLKQQLGGDWHAGIKLPNERAYVNTFDFARKQEDLITTFVEAKTIDPKAAEDLRFSIAATVSARYERHIKRLSESDMRAGIVASESVISMRAMAQAHSSLTDEILREGRRAALRGQTFSGCGVSVSSEESVDGSSISSNLDTLGYGNKSLSKANGKCRFPSKKCPECKARNVMTTVWAVGTRTHIEGSCGCKKVVK